MTRRDAVPIVAPRPESRGRTEARAVIAAALALAVLLLCAAAARAQEEPADDERADRTLIRLDAGRATRIEAPWPVSRVSVTDPEVADVQVLEPTQIIVLGRSVGATDLILWGEEDQVMEITVEVRMDLDRFKGQLERLFPKGRFELDQVEGVVVVGGDLATVEHSERLREFLASSELRHVNMTRVAGVQQVLLQVRVAEASRNALRSLGINAVHTNDNFFGASTIGGNPNAINIGVPEGAAAASDLPFNFLNSTTVGSGVTLFGGFPDADLQVFMQALAENQYLRILAEPTLVAASGEEANFLVGGEFPIPIVQGTAAGGTSISVEFKEFGVRLNFRPTVLGDGAIRLHVAPEVSDVSDIGAVILQDFRIPSLLTRRAETTLEMNSGQTFAMAGLIDQSVNARSSRVPGLGSLPILGALFRSIRYERGETELVVMVTASLVEPVSPEEERPIPGDLYLAPDDWEFYAEGRIESKAPPKLSPAHREWLRELGLDRLRGPGAWSRHGDAPGRSRSAEPDRRQR